jgi:hypothetical protein
MEGLQKGLEQVAAPGAGADLSPDRQKPCFTGHYRCAFYRIFFGHQQHSVMREIEFAFLIAMMIRKRLRGKFQPEIGQLTEKSRRITDTGYRVKAPATQGVGIAMPLAIGNGDKTTSDQRHGELRQNRRHGDTA